MSTGGAKRAARADAKQRLSGVSAELAKAWSASIRERLLGWDEVARARGVMVFAPIPGEPDLGPLVDELVRAGKTVSAPTVDWEAKTMGSAVIGGFGELVESRHGVMQPSANTVLAPLDIIDVVLAPGLAFDASGGRLGRGAGYYDRFLSRGGLGDRACGVAFERQIVDTVPVEGHDLPMRWVVTEGRLIDCPR